MNKVFLAFLFVSIFYCSAYPDKMRIAVIDFKPDGVPENLARKITELIRGEMINTGSYVIIERSSMDEILKEQGFQQSGCADVSCAVKIGKILSARKILVGTIMKIQKRLIINGRIVDIEKGVAEFSQSQPVSSDGDLYNAVVLFNRNLYGKITGKALVQTPVKIEKKPVKTQSRSYSRSSGQNENTASVDGKYYELIQVLHCPADGKSYGSFKEWGYWKGKKWCGQKVKSGYWVWVEPNWYIWGKKRE